MAPYLRGSEPSLDKAIAAAHQSTYGLMPEYRKLSAPFSWAKLDKNLVTHSETVQQAALIPMRVMGICTPFIAVAMILTQALFGAGDTRFVMIVELTLHFRHAELVGAGLPSPGSRRGTLDVALLFIRARARAQARGGARGHASDG